MTLNISDPMFPDRANLRDRDILVGERSNRMVKALERIFDLSLQNPLVTYISGDVGSGKSHLLNHIQFLSEKNKNRLVVVINANQFDSIDALTILRSIHADYTLRQSLRDEILLSDTALLDREKLIYEINNGLELLGRRSTKSKEFGLIVGIDSLDEFIRTRTLDTSKLLITIRLLLEDLHKTCFVLSLTHNILEEAKGKYLAEDRTFSRRFIGPQEYDGSPLNFIGFDRGETFEMYNVYRNRWLKRRLDDGEINQEEYDKFEKSEWPISKEAISLAWEATNNKAPYALQSLFQHALNELRTTAYDEWFNPDNVIQEQQMAHVIEIAVNRAESGVGVDELEFEHTIRILRDEERYLTIPTRSTITPKAKTIVLLIKNLIEESGFTVEWTVHKGKTLYFLNVNGPINNESQSLGLFIALDQAISERGITVLNELVTKGELVTNEKLVIKGIKKIKPRYVIIITNDKNCGGVYDGIGGPRREFTEICHLGNYTYVVQLSDSQIDTICATYQQRNEEYYKALLKIIDKRCCANTGLKLSEILKAIMYATFEQ